MDPLIVMLIRDLMQTDIATLEATDTLDLADDIMRVGRVRHLPVIADGRVVGVLSQRDLFHAGVSSAVHATHRSEQRWLARIRVRDVMTRPAVTVGPATPVARAVELMLEERIGCVPVVEGSGALVGLVSETDCLRCLGHLLGVASASAGLPAADAG